MTEITNRDELVERICNMIDGIENEELADLFNREFGTIKYLGNDEFSEEVGDPNGQS